MTDRENTRPAEDPPAAPAAPPVDCGRQPPLHRRRVFRRVIAGLCALFAALLLVRYAQEKFAATIALVREQRACLEFTMPADTVVYDELRPHDGYDFLRPGLGSMSVRYFSRPDPPLWSSLQARLAPSIAWPDTPLVFLHARRSPAGHERLIAVELAGGIGMNGGGPLVFMRTYIFERPSLSQAFVLRRVQLSKVLTPEPLRANSPFGSRDAHAFAGQPAPQDPLRFTINFETEGRPRALTGTLRDDDTVGFEVGPDLIVEPVK